MKNNKKTPANHSAMPIYQIPIYGIDGEQEDLVLPKMPDISASPTSKPANTPMQKIYEIPIYEVDVREEQGTVAGLVTDVINPLLEQAQQDAGPGIDIDKEPLLSQRTSSIPFIISVCTVVLFAIVTLSAIVKWTTPIHRLTPVRKVYLHKSKKKNVTPGILLKPRAYEKRMQTRALVKWGNFWISQAQARELQKNWLSGGRPPRLPLKLTHNVHYQIQATKSRLIITGQLHLPPMPQGLCLKMRLQLYHALKKGSSYAQAEFFLSKQHKFCIKLELPLLAPNIYFLRFVLPAKQNKFLSYFFRLKREHIWWQPFTVGNTKKINDYRRDFAQEIRNKLKNCQRHYRQLLKFEDLPLQKIRRNWQKWALSHRQTIDDVMRFVKHRQRSSLIPVFPQTESHLPQLLYMLVNLYNECDKRQREIIATRSDLSAKYTEFAMQYRYTCSLLEQEQRLLHNLCQKTAILQHRGR